MLWQGNAGLENGRPATSTPWVRVGAALCGPASAAREDVQCSDDCSQAAVPPREIFIPSPLQQDGWNTGLFVTTKERPVEFRIVVHPDKLEGADTHALATRDLRECV